MTTDLQLWTIIIGLGIGTFLVRFAFLGIIGDRPLPAWVLRHLRYTAVTFIPALVAPLIVWPAATDGQIDIPRLVAAGVALAVGYRVKNVIAAVLSGAATLFVMQQLL